MGRDESPSADAPRETSVPPQEPRKVEKKKVLSKIFQKPKVIPCGQICDFFIILFLINRPFDLNMISIDQNIMMIDPKMMTIDPKMMLL